jgi:hypothetical protein
MRNIIILLSFFYFTNSYTQENFKVIKINGTIVNEQSNSNLVSGSVFNDNDKLKFGNTSSRAAVISPKGRYILQSNNSDIAYAKSFLTPAMSNMSSRSGAIVNQVDLQNHFSGNYLIFKIDKIKVSKDNFPMDENNFFYIRYDYNGESINKKLSYNDDILIIDQKELIAVDGKPIPNPDIKHMELLYYKKAEGKSISVGEFKPVFVVDADLKSEINIILSDLKAKTKKEKIDVILSYINDFYGKPNKENLIDWLEANFQL